MNDPSSESPRPVLAVDLGNTRTKIARVAGSSVEVLLRIPTAEAAERILASELPRLPVFVCSVVAGVLPRVVEALAARTGGVPAVVGEALPLPGELRYDAPETLGADRVLLAHGAFRVHRRSALVCGAGTALTFDWVDDGGAYRGGAIAPGLRVLGEALSGAAAALPRIDPVPGASYPGTSTEDSLRAGVGAAARGTVLELVRLGQASAGPAAPVVLTGGDAALVQALLPEIAFDLRPELLLATLGSLGAATLPGNAREAGT